LRTPVLLVPIGFAANCQSQDLLAALGHECAHIKRRDFMKNLFYEAVSLALAFHPAIWLIKSRIAQTREMVCDAMVAEKLIESRSYANSLLRLAVMVTKSSQVSTAHAIGIFDANILEKRIMSLNIQKQHLSSALKLALTISAALCLLTATIGATAMAVVIEPQSVPQADEPKSYGPIYHVGKEVVAPVMLGSGEVKFPESAQNIKAPFDATLVVGLVVDASGVPHDVHIVRSFRPDFDAKAVQAVEGYRFTPAKRRQKPVAVAVNLDIEFKKY
jgi:TonB family protein